MVVVATRAVSLFLIILLTLVSARFSYALVLPEERADVLYHSYDGGGVTVDGPSVLVRKGIGDSVSVSVNKYMDNVSGASIDVDMITGGSKYTETRDQQSLSVDYLYDKSIMSYSYTESIENDYEAFTHNISMTQEMFGGLTTVGISYTIGNNTVGIVGDPLFSEPVALRGYRLTLSQILTKNTVMSVIYEIITDEGFLRNPYRQVRYDNSSAGDPFNPYILEDESYPNTRTSNAGAVALKYYLPYRAAVSVGYRAFSDTWQITGNNFDIGYVHPVGDDWIFELDFRFYSQTKASFYRDLFDFSNQFQFRARDKELSTYSYNSIGIGMSYEFSKNNASWIKKASVNFSYNYFSFVYEDFLDARVSTLATLGQEPAYAFTADVIRFYFSIWF